MSSPYFVIYSEAQASHYALIQPMLTMMEL
jgi:hypothetical protein